MMNQKTAIVIFSKTPGNSQAKSRLAHETSADLASQVHRILFQSTIDICKNLEKNFRVFACPAENQVSSKIWQGIESIQPDALNLRDRVAEIVNVLLLQYSNVLVLGTDCPDLTKDHLCRAVKQLDENDFVFGPSTDGGFYLMGTRKPIDKTRWSQVSWSQENTLEKVCLSLKDSKIGMMTYLGDIDTLSDLENYLVSSKPVLPDLHCHLSKVYQQFLSSFPSRPERSKGPVAGSSLR